MSHAGRWNLSARLEEGRRVVAGGEEVEVVSGNFADQAAEEVEVA